MEISKEYVGVYYFLSKPSYSYYSEKSLLFISKICSLSLSISIGFFSMKQKILKKKQNNLFSIMLSNYFVMPYRIILFQNVIVFLKLIFIELGNNIVQKIQQNHNEKISHKQMYCDEVFFTARFYL
jgi:hypothetical protein